MNHSKVTPAMLPYEVHAVRYATVARRKSENFIGGDPHEMAERMDYFVWLARNASRTFVIDTGFNQAAAGRRHRDFLRSPVDGLKLLGVDASEVQDVVITHLHYDHVGNFDLFPKARFHLQDREMAYATGRYMAIEHFSHAYEADEVIAATGFTCPLLDLPALGVATFGQSKLPAQTEFWESATVPGIFFAGTITQGSAGLKKHGIPPNSGALHGYRYNARVLVREIGKRHFGIVPERPSIDVGDVRDHLLAEATLAPELWHQKAFLASVVSFDPGEGVRDEGILPLTNFLDSEGPDAVAMTIEADGTSIYPVVYVRRDGRQEEHALDPDPLHDYQSLTYRRALGSILDRLTAGASAA